MIELLEMAGSFLGLAKDVTDVVNTAKAEKQNKELVESGLDALKSTLENNDGETKVSLINNFRIEL